MTGRSVGSGQLVRYGGWSAEGQGWFLGLTGPAWAAVITAGLPVLVAVGTRDWALLISWLPVWAVLAIGVAVPVRGRPAARWARDAVLFAVGRVLGWSAWQSHAAAGEQQDAGELDLPGVLSGVRVHDGPPYAGTLLRPALVADSRAGTWAVVASIAHPGIGLAEPDARAGFGNGLAELLDGAATSELVSSLAVQVRTVPDDGADRNAWRQAHLDPAAPTVALAVDGQLAEAVTPVGVRHQVFVTVVVPEARLARQARDAGGGVDGRAWVLHAVMAEVEARLLGPVGATRVSWLDSPALAAAIRSGYAPGDPTAGVPLAAAGPGVAPAPEARHYTHDAWSSATCAVLLPDKGAVMGALAPVLAPSAPGERRCLTVILEPLGRRAADRLVGAEAMTSDLAAEVRRRSGFRVRAAQRRDAAMVENRDTRLAEGSSLVRVAVAAAVTVPVGWPIADHARRLESAITGSGFTPLRLDLAQDSGFAAACIPLGIGLPRKRGTR